MFIKKHGNTFIRKAGKVKWVKWVIVLSETQLSLKTINKISAIVSTRDDYSDEYARTIITFFLTYVNKYIPKHIYNENKWIMHTALQYSSLIHYTRLKSLIISALNWYKIFEPEFFGCQDTITNTHRVTTWSLKISIDLTKPRSIITISRD